MTRKLIRKMCVVAGLTVMAAAANALAFDAKIVIDRALNSPTLTIRYSGAQTALIELRVNGESAGTRSINSAKESGETNFTVDLLSLRDGDNEIEVRLFDKAGKLVGSQKSLIATDNGTKGTVFLTGPKMGETVQGPVEIKVGFGRELKNTYVSFFIDNEYKSMTNVPPYTYLWDTTLAPSGWHEVEAWVVDESSMTYKTRKTRIFVNNPSGATHRQDLRGVGTTAQHGGGTGIEHRVTPKAEPVAVKTSSHVTGEAGMKARPMPPKPVTRGNLAVPPREAVALLPNPVLPNATGSVSGVKAAPSSTSSATGPKTLTPTGLRVAPNRPVMEINVSHRADTLATVKVAKGVHLPNIGVYTLSYNGSPVDFDVSPRIQDGVPLTPVRHLLEKAGGKVKWDHSTKTVNAFAEGKTIWIQIGDKVARIDKLPVELEMTPFIERGRTIVPLSFLQDALSVDIQYDKATGHVLITSTKKTH